MAIIHGDDGYVREELLSWSKCAKCGVVFREDESDWFSLCQEHGEDEEDEEAA